MRYLESIGTKIAGAILVAGWFTLTPGQIGTETDDKIAEPWIVRPIDTESVKAHTKKVIAIFSDNDRYVPLENAEMFQVRLGAVAVVLHQKGHMGGGDHTTELPEALKAVLTLNS